MTISLPGQGVPVDLPGQVNPTWYERFKDIVDSINAGPPADPSFTEAPLTPGSTSASTSARTIDATLNASSGTDNGHVGYTTIANLYDSFEVIKNCLNALYTNTTNLDTAVDALNTRITALENKLNDVIADLDARFP